MNAIRGRSEVLTVEAFVNAVVDASSTMLIVVGAPGSGKTKIARAFENHGYRRLSMDKIRGEMYGDEGVVGDKQVLFAFYRQLDEALALRCNFVLDAANTNRNQRETRIREARRHGYQRVVIVVMDTPLETCLAWNHDRSRVVPDDVIALHCEKLAQAYPDQAEGGRIIVVRPGPDQDHVNAVLWR